jgi:hypothetical protein
MDELINRIRGEKEGTSENTVTNSIGSSSSSSCYRTPLSLSLSLSLSAAVLATLRDINIQFLLPLKRIGSLAKTSSAARFASWFSTRF